MKKFIIRYWNYGDTSRMVNNEAVVAWEYDHAIQLWRQFHPTTRIVEVIRL